MKRDKNLWLLILRGRATGTEPPELKNYNQAEVIYNASLLVNGGYVDGSVIENGNGIAATVVMLQMTNAGHDLLESLEAEYQKNNQPSSPMPSTSQTPLSIFISHSAKDEKLAGALVSLLRSALNIPADKIRCTSVNGYRLPIGADTEDRLRDEVQDAKAFIGLITPTSIASAYVMFELGARWGAKLYLAPLLGAGAGVECLRGPLGSLNALNCEDSSHVHQFISDLSKHLEIQATSPAVYQHLIDALIESSKAGIQVAAAKTTSQPSKPPAAPLPIISKEENAVLSLFARAGEQGLVKEAIIQRFNLHPLKIDQILENLVKRDYLELSVRMGIGMLLYRLTSKGRDYLIENNML